MQRGRDTTRRLLATAQPLSSPPRQTPRSGKRLLPGAIGSHASAGKEMVIKAQKRHIDAPVPHEPVCRRRTFSAGPTLGGSSATERGWTSSGVPSLTQSITSDQGFGGGVAAANTGRFSASARPLSAHGARTMDRIFPSAEQAAATARPRSASASSAASRYSNTESFAVFSGNGTPAPPTAPKAKRVVTPRSALKEEHSLKDEMGERRRIPTPGQVAGGLYTILSHNAPPPQVRPLLRQKDHCRVLVEENVVRPYRHQRKGAGQDKYHDTFAFFCDGSAAAAPLSVTTR